MSENFDPLELPSSLARQLRRKSCHRRSVQERLAQTSVVQRRRKDLLPRLDLLYLPLSDIRPSSRKLRRLDPAHVREVAAAIAALGFCDPLLIGRGAELLHGEVRYEAARQLVLDRVPCIRIDHLDLEEQRVLRLAVNRLSEKGQWDLDALKVEFEELILTDAPIEVSGFDPAEIDQIILGDGVEGLEHGPLEPEPSATPTSRLGDVFQLGPHRIVCADATDRESVRRVIAEGEMARLVLTDEPYTFRSPATSPRAIIANSRWRRAR